MSHILFSFREGEGRKEEIREGRSKGEEERAGSRGSPREEKKKEKERQRDIEAKKQRERMVGGCQSCDVDSKNVLVFLVAAKTDSWPESLQGCRRKLFLWHIMSTTLHSVIPEDSVSPCLGRVLNVKFKHVLNLSLKALCSSTEACQKQIGGSFT